MPTSIRRRVGPIPYEQLDPHQRRLYDMSAMGEYEITEDDIRAARHGYYASISYVDQSDRHLARDTRRPAVLLDNTIIVFTSDHGDFLGERGLWYKMSFRETVRPHPADRLGARSLPAAPRRPAGLAGRSAADAAHAIGRHEPNCVARSTA